MRYVHIGSDPVPALGLGTWQLRDADCVEAVRHALELGYRHIDTAAMYGNEAEVGRGIAESGVPRDEIFLTTKVWHQDLAPQDVETSVARSLQRLDVDHVDLLLVHWPNAGVPLEWTLKAMAQARARGHTRHIGVSNFPSALWNQARQLAPVVCNQVEYHPYLDQTAVIEALDGGVLTAYCPLARGDVAHDPVLTEIGRAHGKTAAQIALRWLIQQPGVCAIPKASRPEHREANLDLFDFSLSEEERSRVAELASPDGRRIQPPWAPRWDE